MSHGTQFATILFFGAVAAWYGPDIAGSGGLDSQGAPAEATRARNDQARLGRMELKRRDNWMSGETVLERERDGHFYASITVDSRDYRVLVDTGASIVALTEQDALDMGLSWDDSEVRVIARGASGDVRGVPVTIPQMQMGGFEAQDVQAAIVPEGLDITLLGQSFLGKIDNVEISGDRMVFGG